MSLDAYLKENNIVGIQGIDTRALVRHIRDKGAQTGIISSVDLDAERLVEKALKAPSIVGRDLVREVTCKEAYHWSEGPWDLVDGYQKAVPPSRFKVVAYDFGIKRNILRNLVESGCDVTVVPADTPAEEVLAMNPDGIFLSNGPGDPEPIVYAQENIRQILGKKPLFRFHQQSRGPDPHQSQRQHRRGPLSQGTAGFFRSVPPRSLPGTS
jgi:carbamoyl-phosphate synthase small subunit